MKESRSANSHVQGPEQNIEMVVKQQDDENAKKILEGYWKFVQENPQVWMIIFFCFIGFFVTEMVFLVLSILI